ncbi:MAG: translation initiation factor IF-5A [Nanoarchaeales archaeon]|nr:translation initiation factor IF-5A [Nanoarchaeales archaeon]
MSDIKSTHAGALKSGSYVLINGAPCIVKDTQTSRPGKHGHAKVRVKATDIFTGSTKEVVMPGHDSVDVPIVLKKQGSITNIEGENIDLMDLETFETVAAELKYADVSVKDKLEAGQTVMFWQIMGKIMIKSIVEE